MGLWAERPLKRSGDAVAADMRLTPIVCPRRFPASFAVQAFIEESDPIMRHNDYQDTLLPLMHNKRHPVDGLPDRLIQAMRAFVLAHRSGFGRRGQPSVYI